MATNNNDRPTMDWDAENIGETFSLFKRKAQAYFRVYDIDNDKQLDSLMLMMGDKGIKKLDTWKLSAEQEKNMELIWKKYQDSLQPIVNFRVARLQLQQMKQQNGESIDQFIEKLTAQANKCDFEDRELETRVIEQVTYGTLYKDLHKDLLKKAKDFKLAEMLSIGRNHEASLLHQKQMAECQANQSKSVTVSYVKNKTYSSKTKCTACGREHPPKRCPAHGSTCKKCGKKNHWADMCKTQEGKPQHKQKPRKAGNLKKRSAMYNITQQEQDSGSEPEVSLYSHLEQLEHLTFNSIAMGCVTTSRTERLTGIQIQVPRKGELDSPLTVKIDTGAEGNALPLREFKRIYPEHMDKRNKKPRVGILKPSNTRLIAYDDKPITCFGVLPIRCKHPETETPWEEQDFYVVDVDGPAILGLPACEKLKVLNFNISSLKRSDKASKPVESTNDLMELYPNSFDGVGNFPGNYKIIVDKDVQPIVHPFRKTPIQLVGDIKKELAKMEADGIIEKVTEPTDWVSSLVCSRKANGKLRLCLDPKDLNKAVKRPHHKTPTLEEISHKLEGSKYFSKLDAKNGYWSVHLHPESQKLTTFNSPTGRYFFKRLPFGLVCSQDVFQQRMDMILEQCKGAIGIADDVAVFGQTKEEHNKNLHELMQVAEQYGLMFNSSKCEIMVSSIMFMGIVWNSQGAKPDPSKVTVIKKLKTPENRKELQEFLGIVNYMSPFIPRLADLNEPLRKLNKNKAEFEWTESHTKVYDIIKDAICSETQLSYFNPDLPIKLQVDASKVGIGAALVQTNAQGQDRPVAFASKALTDVEQRYANIERELLAVVFATEKFHTYVYGTQFIAESDHKPLEMIALKNLNAAPPRLQRMLLRLQHYDLQIQYKPGKEMVLADALSRLGSNCGDTASIALDIKVCPVQFSQSRLEQVRAQSQADPVLRALASMIIAGWPDEHRNCPKILRDYWPMRDELSIENGVIFKGCRTVIPGSMYSYILENLHAGHQGMVKTKLRAKTAVFWPKINKDIEEMCSQCHTCQKHAKSNAKETLKHQEVPTRPWQMIGTDLFKLENREYLIIADYFSKMFFVRIVSSPVTSKAVTALTKQILAEQGLPDVIISDNGPQFAGFHYKQFCEQWQIKHKTSSPHYPQSNGFIERMIQTVKATLKKCKETKTDPEMALLCLRSTPVDSTLPSPSELLYQRKLCCNLPGRAQYDDPNKDSIRSHLQQRQQQTPGHDLTDLAQGQLVYHQDQQNNQWFPAQVVSKAAEPRSYFIETEAGVTVRRNRRHLKERVSLTPAETSEQQRTFNLPPTPTVDKPNVTEHNRLTTDNTTQQTDNTPQQAEADITPTSPVQPPSPPTLRKRKPRQEQSYTEPRTSRKQRNSKTKQSKQTVNLKNLDSVPDDILL